MDKPLMFPRNGPQPELTALFTEFSWVGTSVAREKHRYEDGKVLNLGGHTTHAGPFRCFTCVPTQAVLDYIGEKMIAIDNDLLYFSICCREDGTALVSVQYNQIIGSRWLAELLPGWEP